MRGRPATLARRARSVRATAVALSAVLAGGVAGALVLGHGPQRGSAAPGASPPASPAASPAASASTGASQGASLPPGQSVVTGTVTTAEARGATGPSLSTPLEITVPVRGRGGATFFDVTVDGQPSSVVWNGGVPLGLIGHGAIVPGRIGVTVDGSGSTWSLDGAERILAPGTYDAAAPVAVGQAGLAQSRDSAQFTAGSRSVVETTGGATVRRDPRPLHLVGPGSLSLTGTLQVLSRSGTVTVHSLALASGSFEVDLVPAGGGLTVHATVHGAFTTR